MADRRSRNRGKGRFKSVTDYDVYLMSLDNIYFQICDYLLRSRIPSLMERNIPRPPFLPTRSPRGKFSHRNGQDGLLPTPEVHLPFGQFRSYSSPFVQHCSVPDTTNYQPVQPPFVEQMLPRVLSDPSQIPVSDVLVLPSNPSFKVFLLRPFGVPRNGRSITGPVQPTVSYMSSSYSLEMMIAEDPRLFPAMSLPVPPEEMGTFYPIQFLPKLKQQTTDRAEIAKQPGLPPNCRFVNGEMVFYEGEYIKHEPAQLPDELKQPMGDTGKIPHWVQNPEEWEESSCFFTPDNSRSSSGKTDKNKTYSGFACGKSMEAPAQQTNISTQPTLLNHDVLPALEESHAILKAAAEAVEEGVDLIETASMSLFEYEQMVKEFKSLCEIDP